MVVGAGPAGLMAAHELLQAGIAVTLLERRPATGGLGGTTVFEGKAGSYRFDFGGHRFITANAKLLALVEELVGKDLLFAERRSVIRLGGRTYDYPLSAGNLLASAPKGMLLGAVRDLMINAMRQPTIAPDADFATWTRARFGDTLYRTFFEGYTRKLWGIDPSTLSGDWASQRISLVDLRDVAQRLLPGRQNAVRTYARGYRYPRLGFGMIFERLAARILEGGAEIRQGVTVTGFEIGSGRITAVETDQGRVPCDAVISTMPLPEMVRLTGGDCALRFRGLRFFNLPMQVEDVSPYTWQYLSDPCILATRLQEPKRRSSEMAPPGHSSLMLEIPCDPGDKLWAMPDAELWPLMQRDLQFLGIDADAASGEHFSVRAATAYPLMVQGYQLEREKAFRHLSGLPNLIQCGRQGSFRYVFTDTAMEMGQMAAQSIIEGADLRDEIRNHRNETVVIETQSVA